MSFFIKKRKSHNAKVFASAFENKVPLYALLFFIACCFGYFKLVTHVADKGITECKSKCADIGLSYAYSNPSNGEGAADQHGSRCVCLEKHLTPHSSRTPDGAT